MTRGHPVAAHLVGHPWPFDRVDLEPHRHRVLARGLPRLVGQRGVNVEVLGHVGTAWFAPRHLAVHPVDPEGSRRGAVEIPGHEVPVAEAEAQSHGRDAARLAAVAE